jgi:ABC-type nitrate/sulfonate/bicarbonate transport system substrate-binding protein
MNVRRVAFAVLALTLFANASARAQSSLQEPIRVAASITGADTGPVLYALKQGLFKKAGLDIEFSSMTSGGAIAQAVAGGSIDIGYANTPAMITGHARGIPFLLIAPEGQYETDFPESLMFVRKDSKLASGKDFAGKTIGVPTLLDMQAISMIAWIDATGGDSSTVKFIELPPSAILPALLDGRIDACSFAEPWKSQALAGGNARVLAKAMDAIAPHLLVTGWFATRPYVETHRDAVVRFEHVMQDAAKYANAHRLEMVSYIADFTKIDAGALAEATGHVTYPTALDPALLQPLINVSAKYKLIPKSFDAGELISPTALKADR